MTLNAANQGELLVFGSTKYTMTTAQQAAQAHVTATMSTGFRPTQRLTKNGIIPEKSYHNPF